MRIASPFVAVWLLGACAHSGSGERTTTRLPDRETVLEAAYQRWKTVEQIPSFLVTAGSLANVPYSSYRVGPLELNVYGDPEDPAAVELGTYEPTDASKAEVLAFLESVLPIQADREALRLLDPNGAVVPRGAITLEATPPTAPDAYGGWWISLYSPALLAAARAGPTEEISAPATPEPPPSAGWRSSDYSRSHRYHPTVPTRVYTRTYYRRGPTYYPGRPQAPRPPRPPRPWH